MDTLIGAKDQSMTSLIIGNVSMTLPRTVPDKTDSADANPTWGAFEERATESAMDDRRMIAFTLERVQRTASAERRRRSGARRAFDVLEMVFGGHDAKEQAHDICARHDHFTVALRERPHGIVELDARIGERASRERD
jgi:hypothetical protein